MDNLEANPVPGTEGAINPFFSPDSQWLGFFAGEELKKVPLSGGAGGRIADTTNPRGGDWGLQGVMVFAPNTNTALLQASDAGGELQPLTRLDTGEVSHRWPDYLPDGNAVLFAASTGASNWSNAQIAVHSTETRKRANLVRGATFPRYASSGHLIYAQAGTLMAAPFDVKRLELTGTPVPVVEGVYQSTSNGHAQFSFSNTGSLVYVEGGIQSAQRALVWVSRDGTEEPLKAPLRAYRGPRISPGWSTSGR